MTDSCSFSFLLLRERQVPLTKGLSELVEGHWPDAVHSFDLLLAECGNLVESLDASSRERPSRGRGQTLR
jgi:hypothetical protein